MLNNHLGFRIELSLSLGFPRNLVPALIITPIKQSSLRNRILLFNDFRIVFTWTLLACMGEDLFLPLFLSTWIFGDEGVITTARQRSRTSKCLRNWDMGEKAESPRQWGHKSSSWQDIIWLCIFCSLSQLLLSGMSCRTEDNPSKAPANKAKSQEMWEIAKQIWTFLFNLRIKTFNGIMPSSCQKHLATIVNMGPLS